MRSKVLTCFYVGDDQGFVFRIAKIASAVSLNRLIPVSKPTDVTFTAWVYQRE